MSLLQEEKQEELPARVPAAPARLEPERPDDEAVLIREVADLVAEEGHVFGVREVRVYGSRVSIHDSAGRELRRVPMAEVRSARTEPLVGGGRLELTMKDGRVLALVEFTASIAARFSEMARGIEQLAKG